MPIQSTLPTFKKGVWPTNLKIIKISANEMEKLNCFKNLRATVPPTASKQQTLPIPILEQIHKLNCTENDDIRHLLSKLVKAIRDDSIVAISKSHKEVTKSQSMQGEKTVSKDQVPSFVNMSASEIQRNHKSHAKVGKRKKSLSKSTSINIFSSSASQDDIYRYDPESERSREDIISYSKLNESQEKVSPKKDISYKLRRDEIRKNCMQMILLLTYPLSRMKNSPLNVSVNQGIVMEFILNFFNFLDTICKR
ncbi:hypothetical protein TNCT_116811 [Trichonephila clavata]|uniref:Uncharacterized protein n=1 Tax=Trichonephila clavata TaxID=2740835 RepID=A0A8X6KUT7_TRICU|nr:hypothetical protein TNCT_116811 [Trichonephila clavata]